MAEDGEDPVVHEIDVFLSKTSADQLFLFQYPVRPISHGYDSVTNVGAKMKPKQQKVELDLHVNTRSANFCRSKGEQFALNVDGSSSGYDERESRHFKSGVFDKQVLSSSPALSNSSNYAIGVLKDGQLHLTPLKGIIQLKPDLTYLDKADTKHKGAGDKMDAGDSSQDEAEEEAKPVVVKFGRQETEDMKARRLASYEHMSQVKDDEPWVKLTYHGVQSHNAERERLRLFASGESGVNEFQMSSADYFKQLLPEAEQENSEKPALPTNVLSLSQLRTLPLPDQVRALLINAKAIRFAQLLALLPGNPDAVAVLRYLQQVASLVQGCWVIKSEILYPKDTFSAHSGVNAEYICRGRDYIMWKFTQSRFVVRRNISSAIKLPAEEVKELLEQMSRMKANLGWEFVFEYDKDFVDRHTDIAQRQKMLWDARFQTLCTQLKLSKETEKKGRDQMGISQIPQRKRRPSAKSPRSRTLSGRSCSDMSDTDNETSKQPPNKTNDTANSLDKPKTKPRAAKSPRRLSGRSCSDMSDTDNESAAKVDVKPNVSKLQNPTPKAQVVKSTRRLSGRSCSDKSDTDNDAALKTDIKVTKPMEVDVNSVDKPKVKPSSVKATRHLSGQSDKSQSDTDNETTSKQISSKLLEMEVDNSPIPKVKPKVNPQRISSDVDMESGSNTESTDNTESDSVESSSNKNKKKNSNKKKSSNVKNNLSNGPGVGPGFGPGVGPRVGPGVGPTYSTERDKLSRKVSEEGQPVLMTKPPIMNLSKEILKQNQAIANDVDNQSEPSDVIDSNIVPNEQVSRQNGEFSSELDRELMEFAKVPVTTKFVMTQSELKKLFALKLMQCPAGHILGTGVSYHLIEAAILKAGAVKMNTQKWPQDAIKEPTYVTAKLDDNLNSWREVLIEVFEAHHRNKIGVFKERLEEKLNCTFTDVNIKNFLRDYCTARGSKWILKGTLMGQT